LHRTALLHEVGKAKLSRSHCTVISAEVANDMREHNKKKRCGPDKWMKLAKLHRFHLNLRAMSQHSRARIWVEPQPSSQKDGIQSRLTTTPCLSYIKTSCVISFSDGAYQMACNDSCAQHHKSNDKQFNWV
jgi:hypothetical protein